MGAIFFSKLNGFHVKDIFLSRVGMSTVGKNVTRGDKVVPLPFLVMVFAADPPTFRMESYTRVSSSH